MPSSYSTLRFAANALLGIHVGATVGGLLGAILLGINGLGGLSFGWLCCLILVPFLLLVEPCAGRWLGRSPGLLAGVVGWLISKVNWWKWPEPMAALVGGCLGSLTVLGLASCEEVFPMLRDHLSMLHDEGYLLPPLACAYAVAITSGAVAGAVTALSERVQGPKELVRR